MAEGGERRDIPEAVEAPLRDYTNPLEVYRDPEDVRRHFRLLPEAILWLCALLRPDLERRQPYGLPVLMQVCIALKFFGSGAFFINVGALRCLDVSLSSAWRATNAVAEALTRRARDFVRFPAGRRLQEVKRGFRALSGKNHFYILAPCLLAIS